MKKIIADSLTLTALFMTLTLFLAGCDGGGGGNEVNDPTGTLTATLGSTTYNATRFTILTSNGAFRLISRNDDDDTLILAFIDINAPGQFPLVNEGLTLVPGVAGGYLASGETYNIDAGTINITTYSNARVAGTFSGTARGLLGAPDLALSNGSFDVRF